MSAEELAEPQDLPMAPGALRRVQAAKYLGLSPRMFDQYVRPTLACVQVGEAVVLYPVVELDRWLLQRVGPPPERHRPAREEAAA